MSLVQVCANRQVTLDALVLSQNASQEFLFQACTKTGGLYMFFRYGDPAAKLDKSLCEYFLSAFGINRKARAHVRLPHLTIESAKAACNCHAKLVEIGWVCSSCLAVYCAPQPPDASPHCLFCGVTLDLLDYKEAEKL